MQKHPEITLRRLGQFVKALEQKLYPARQPVALSVYSAPDRVTYDEAMQGEYRPAEVGEKFGPDWSTHWFRVGIEIPHDWQGTEVHFLFDSGSEGCVWEGGLPRQGLTGRVPDLAATRPEYILTRAAAGGESREIYVEMAVNHLFGLRTGGGLAGDNTTGHLYQAEIGVFDREAWDLLWDFATVTDMAKHLPADTPRHGQALALANQMCNTIDLDDPSTWAEARAMARPFLSDTNGSGQHNLSAIGHAHIDSAWLWPLAETKRKCTRTFSTALQLMEEYPDYKFVLSQAAQWEWMRDLQPELYKKMLARAKENRFIPAGGSWIEPDCNIPSGESLVRQFLYGQRYFQSELGVRCNEFWNPDVFGYCAQLPQIMAGCGINYFLTQKLSWNQFNKMPSHTFYWEALDGSRVLTHFPPADTYNSQMNVQELLFNVKNYKDHERGKESYLLFGYGDGGGGPTRAMLERYQRMNDLDGLPRTKTRTPAEFFERLDADLDDALTWVGELYFELHRGTYTSQANNKKWNRESEFLLRDVEMLAGLAHVQDLARYPHEQIDPLWKTLLFNQFHDIIPGSSINEVYRDSDEDYARILGESQELRQSALGALFGSDGSGENLRAVNSLSTGRREVVELPAGISGHQASADGAQLGIISAPALGQQVQTAEQSDETVTASESNDGITLANAYVSLTIGSDGRVTRMHDLRADRPVLDGPGNNLVLFEDRPLQWEAWDVDVFHLEKCRAVGAASSVTLIETGPLRATVEAEFSIGKGSKMVQRISLTAISPRVDFDCKVDWHEDKQFLKVEFPVNVRALHANYEMQFGHVSRPTHMNTSWDMARFEVCGHKWADLSEPDYGVALLSDSKYGWATAGNVMRMSLLRAPKSPDEHADMGEHHFRYAVFPHQGSLQQAGVVQEGYRFNSPMILRPTADTTGQSTWFTIDADNVIVDTVKKAEDSNALILRIFEAHGARSTVTITSPLPVTNARLCNMLEDDGDELPWTNGALSVDITPFKVLTIKLEF